MSNFALEFTSVYKLNTHNFEMLVQVLRNALRSRRYNKTRRCCNQAEALLIEVVLRLVVDHKLVVYSRGFFLGLFGL